MVTSFGVCRTSICEGIDSMLGTEPGQQVCLVSGAAKPAASISPCCLTIAAAQGCRTGSFQSPITTSGRSDRFFTAPMRPKPRCHSPEKSGICSVDCDCPGWAGVDAVLHSIGTQIAAAAVDRRQLT